ncbi:MAG: serine/threonine-protein kinase [Polyangiaceae bacterium]
MGTQEDRPIELHRTERYVLHDEIATGGMASVHLGVLEGALGFSRIVAIKRLHGALASDGRFVSMLIDEARLVSRIRHVNVVTTLDIIERSGEVFVIMEYVRGASLAKLIELSRTLGDLVPLPVAIPIMVGALRGLGAAHDATDLDGTPLEIVHRDVSPQNILVGTGGVPRVIDFGVARAVGRLSDTRSGEFKGKLAYASPEQLSGGEATRQSDVFAASIVLWELITGRRLFHRPTPLETLREALDAQIRSPTAIFDEDERMRAARNRHDLEALSEVVMRGLERDPAKRFATAEAMAQSLETSYRGASASEVGAWVQSTAAHDLARDLSIVARAEALMAARAQTARVSRASFTAEAKTVVARPGAPSPPQGANGDVSPPPGPSSAHRMLALAVVVAIAAALGAAVGGALVARMLVTP